MFNTLPYSAFLPLNSLQENNNPQSIRNLFRELDKLSKKYKDTILVIGPARKAKLIKLLNYYSDIKIQAATGGSAINQELIRRYDNAKRFVKENLAADTKEQQQLEVDFMKKYGTLFNGAIRVSATGRKDYFSIRVPQSDGDRLRRHFIVAEHVHPQHTMRTVADPRDTSRIMSTMVTPNANNRANGRTRSLNGRNTPS